MSPAPPPYTALDPLRARTYNFRGLEKAPLQSEVSWEEEKRIADWADAEQKRVNKWQISETTRIEEARQKYGNKEADKALERMRSEVASAYQRVEREREAAI